MADPIGPSLDQAWRQLELAKLRDERDEAVARAEAAERDRDESDRQWRFELERFKAAVARAERAEREIARLHDEVIPSYRAEIARLRETVLDAGAGAQEPSSDADDATLPKA